MDCSMPGFPVHHISQSLLKLMPLSRWCHPTISSLLSPSSHIFNLSQHQSLFQGVSSSHQVPKYWSFSFSISPSNEYSGLISFRIDWLDLAAQGTLESSPTSQYYSLLRGFSHGSDGKESACNAGDPGSIPGLGIPWRRKWQPTPVFLPGEFNGQRSLAGYGPWGHKELNTDRN